MTSMTLHKFPESQMSRPLVGQPRPQAYVRWLQARPAAEGLPDFPVTPMSVSL
jgi:hypothetical protein